MVGFAFMLSAFVSKASSSTTVGFTIFILGFLSQLVTTAGFPYGSGFSKTSRFIWSLFPPNLLAKALKILADATSTSQDPGISLSGITECGPYDFDCVITLSDIYKWLMATFVIWFVLAIYLDNIVPNASGVKKPVYYFLTPGYWIGIGGNKVKEGDNYSSAPPLDGSTPDDVDVLEEENVKRWLLLLWQKTAPYHAVKGLWVNFAKDQLFCLLGPNGAGKTTTISCLTGLAPVTGGDALIYGHSARSSVGMANIRKIIGVCPQFDILWSALTGQEHLHLFATIKGLPQSSIESTTGMDPITRRHVWDIIEDAKKGRAIVLTTHSMEEADILSDRIGIMAKGKLRCIGTSIRLKSRFGSGFIANVSFSGSTNSVNTPHHEAVKLFFEHHLGVLPKEENSAFLTFVIPHDKEGLLTELQDRQREFNIADIQLGLTTLEEVFLNIARQAELEAAITEGRLVTLTLTSGASFDIPVGTKYTVIPGTVSPQYPRGFMVEVYWDRMSPVNSAFLATHLKLQYLQLVDRPTYIFQTRIAKRLLRLVTTSLDGVVILVTVDSSTYFFGKFDEHSHFKC
ncbi:ABC transporter A family member 2 [Prunus yedoensis var. nudiflora]|uniref:ABC transporter A family member 2 n=1 Tax=Prunus yedoensis var. nudiflora TaxID=2094558 RepID=A0A314YY32_PRUYE|nr:ABC transporter A family member 2 [Prunus yedoensis var. nudiflora]